MGVLVSIHVRLFFANAFTYIYLQPHCNRINLSDLFSCFFLKPLLAFLLVLILNDDNCRYTSKMLLAAIDERHRGTYDFIYLPIDFKASAFFTRKKCFYHVEWG